MVSFRERFPAARPLIGVIHLPPLPGYEESPGLAAVVAHALAELATYRVGGLDGVLVENENDRPHRVEAGRETIAVMTAVTRALVAAANRLPIGIEILLNDPEASLAVAHASGADFIRSDYFADEMSRPVHGAMRSAPEQVIAFRARIGAERVLVLAAREGAGDCPLLIGSGLAPANARELLEVADGAIVGTSLMRAGKATAEQVTALTAARS